MTQEAIRNIEVLRDIVAAHPQELFDLESFSYERDCGTLYCTVGLAACQPYFQMKGLKLNHQGVLEIKGALPWSAAGSEALEAIFGGGSFSKLFNPRGEGTQDAWYPGAIETCYDEDYGDYDVEIPEGVSDKTLALWRLDRELTRLKTIEGVVA